MEAETGVMWPQAREHLGLPETGRKKKGSFLGCFKGSMALTTPWLWISNFQNWDRINLCCLKATKIAVLCYSSLRKVIHTAKSIYTLMKFNFRTLVNTLSDSLLTFTKLILWKNVFWGSTSLGWPMGYQDSLPELINSPTSGNKDSDYSMWNPTDTYIYPNI